ncbi:MAG: ATP-dependent RNA helicase HrpA [Acidimicrobiia bacterium]
MSDLADLRARIDGLPAAERRVFTRRLGGVGRVQPPERRARIIERIGRDLAEVEKGVGRRMAAMPATISYPDLPITERRHDLLATIAEHQVVIVAGETGSGKSTQLPKLCLEARRGVAGLIGHTQPRRIAARSIAERVAEELGTEVGGLVGYTVRFADQVGDDTLIRVMTDGILLAEIHRDPRLGRYDTIIIDEAHERSLNIDFLLGYLQRLLPDRPDLKVIITSATIDTARFAEHFGGAPVVEVSGRTFPVEVRYRPLDDPDQPEPRDQPQGIADAVAELAAEGTGDILVFCSGEREIGDAADAITELNLRHTEILPLFGRLSASEQHRVFESHTGRRVVLATNVAETSLTVPGIMAVVDPGTARISRAGRTGVQRLPIEPISRASANQRAGRCGRIAPGVCIRLYSEDDFEGRDEFTEPEIQRTNLASVILQMAALGLGDIESYPFLDPPDARNIRSGVALLEELGALDPDSARLTDLGRRIARVPIDPRMARMVIAADATACLREVLVIAAALSILDPRERPTDKEQQAAERHRRFADPDSDLLGWLRLWDYLGEERRARTSSQFRKMCKEDFLNYRRIREWQDIHSQLRRITTEMGMAPNSIPAEPDAVHRALLTGLLSQIGSKDPDSYEYRGARATRFAIAPGSALFKKNPQWVMAADIVETSRTWARGVARIQPEWVEQAGAHLVKRSYSDPWWDQKKGSAVATETVTLFGLPVVPARTVLYGRIDPVASRDIFISHALVLGEWESPHAFVAHNRDRIAEVEALQVRERRFDLLVTDETIAGWFDVRVPDQIVSSRHFDRWWRDEKSKNQRLLELSTEDLIDPEVERSGDEAFPAVWHYGDVEMPIAYEFDPASPTDGVTVDVPLDRLDRVDPSIFDWQVPGLRRELIETLIRSLPKTTRKTFIPIAETVETVVARLESGTGGLRDSLRRELTRLGGVPIDPEAFDLARLPPHLRPTFRVVGPSGEVVASGDDLGELKNALVAEARAVMTSTTHPLEQTGLTGWSIGELPRRVEVANGVRAYPALIDARDSVSVRLLATPDEAEQAMRQGTRRLLLLVLPSPGKLLRPLITDRAKLILKAGPYDLPSDWADDCLAAAVDHIVNEAGGPAWDGVGFDRLLRTTRDRLDRTITEFGRRSLAVMEQLWAVGVAVDGLPTNPALAQAVADITAQVNVMIYQGFVTAVGMERLADIERYLTAAERRLERLPADPGRDATLMAQVHALELEHDRLMDAVGATPELIEVAWMLQELRVSLFAQQLGTRGTVSAARISRALAEAIA